MFNTRKRVGGRALLFAVASSLSLFSYSNLTQAQDVEDDSVLIESVDEEIEEVVITGSRIQRNEFSSAAPVQIIQGETAREVGLIDTAGLIQSSTTATGTQIDNTFTAFVLDNGPGAAQVNLRGLGPEKTLIMVNSRRLAPAGVGGAPTSADLNTIPSIMIDRVETLLDGASSVYGSDAVAGVVNVIMRKDFEGFDVELDLVAPEDSGGDEANFGIAWGKSYDRGSIGLGIEFYDRGTLKFSDRPYTSECNRNIQIDENGVIRSDDLSLAPGTTINGCKLSTINRVFVPGTPYGNIWYTPGSTNIAIPNFSETTVDPGLSFFNSDINPITGVIDPDGDGLTSVDLKDNLYNYNGSARDRDGDYVTGLKRFNLYGYGDYELQDDNNTSLFFEVLYNRRETELFSPGATIFPDVPSTNPYNPCNQNAPNGVNCFGFFGPFQFGSQDAIPIIAVRGDRDNNSVELDQLRLVGGVEGDLPVGEGWGYELSVAYSRSDATDVSTGIREDNLLLSLNTSAIDPGTGQVVCGADANGDGIPDGQGCVPVNLFADSLYQPGGGDFATQAERDFVFANRTFDTEFTQTIFSGVFQGDIGKLPWNDTEIPLVVGFEYRRDEVASIPNDVARDGLLIAFFSDGGAQGSRNLKEVFVETELQIAEGRPFAEELSLNLSGRWTDESTYGSDFTYSAKMIYSPTDALTLRGTYGTSYRAPNAREQFLAGQSGFAAIADPCVVPLAARIPSINPNDPAAYDPTMDDRSQTTLSNCAANGVDPTALGLANNTQPQYSAEVLQRGGQELQLNIDPETSTSATAGVVFKQPWTDSFDFTASATYFSIRVEDNIGLLNPGFLINDCFVDNANNSSGFCRLITRDTDGLISLIDSSFVNINQLTSKGVDFNFLLEKDFIVNDRNLAITADLRATRLNEQLFVFEGASDEDAGTTNAPEWEAVLSVEASYQDLTLNWRTSYIGGGEETPEDFSADDTCVGLGVLCRPLFFTDDYTVHTASLSWEPRDWRFTLGVRNLFDTDPELIDTSAPGTQLNNLPLGVGYDHFGRSIFFAVRKSL